MAVAGLTPMHGSAGLSGRTMGRCGTVAGARPDPRNARESL